MKPQIDSLLQKKMDRRAFLKHVGIGFIVLSGATTLLKTLNTLGGSTGSTQNKGYGSSAYGGQRAPKN